MTSPKFRFILLLLVSAVTMPTFSGSEARPVTEARAPNQGEAMVVQYLEVVTPDVDATCNVLEKLHDVSFGDPDAALGHARTAVLRGGGTIGVRAPMHEGEHPVVRPYVLVENIETAIEAAKVAGAEIAVPLMEIPGHGKIAIYILGGIQHGLWQR